MGLVYRDHSFYTLEVFVGPAGARESMIFISSQIDEIKTALHYSMDYPDAIYLTIWYGRQIYLTVYQHGTKTQVINLLPHLTIQIPAFPEISFDADGNLQGIYFSDLLNKGDPEAAFQIDTDDFIDLVTADNFKFSFFIDWASIPYPTLEGTLAMPGEKVVVETCNTREILPLPYGCTEFEDGATKADFDWETDMEF